MPLAVIALMKIGSDVLSRFSGSPVVMLNIPKMSKDLKFKYSGKIINCGGTTSEKITPANKSFLHGKSNLAKP